MKSGVLRLTKAVVYLGILGAGWIAKPLLADHCRSLVSAEYLSENFQVSPSRAKAVAEHPSFGWVANLAALYGNERIRTELPVDVVRALRESPLDSSDHFGLSLKLLVKERITLLGIEGLTLPQTYALAETLLRFLHCDSTRAWLLEEPTRAAEIFPAAIQHEVKNRVAQVMRTEKRLSRAFNALAYWQQWLDREGVHVVPEEEEVKRGISFVVTGRDFRDDFERVALREYFGHRRYQLFSAGESLRLLLGMQEGEYSADLLGIDPETEDWVIAEVKQNPNSLPHAVEQLEETWVRLQEIAHVHGQARLSVAFPRGGRLPEGWTVDSEGRVLKDQQTFLIDGLPVFIDWFAFRR